jgi:hypothetical protein
VHDRHEPLDQAGQQHRVPLQPLGRVHRGERHALDRRRVAQFGAERQLGGEVAQGGLRPRRVHVVGQLGQGGEGFPALAGRRPARGRAARGRAAGEADAAQHVPDRGRKRVPGVRSALAVRGGRLAAGRAAEQHQRLADHRPLVEPLGAAHHVGHLGLRQRLLEPLGVGVDPDQHGDFPGRHARPDQRPDRRRHPGRLAGVVAVLGEHRPRPGRPLGDQRRAGPDELVGHRDHLRRRPVVAHQPDERRAGELGGEAGQVVRRGTGERVDHLVRVPDHAQLVAVAEPGVEQQLLQRVHVLVLVDHEVPERVAHLVGRAAVLEHDGGGQLEHRLEVDQVPLAPQPFVAVVDERHGLRSGRGRAARRRGGAGVFLRPDLGRLGPLDLAGRVGQPRAVQMDPRLLGRLAHQAHLGIDQLRRPTADHPRPEVFQLAQRGRVEGGRPHLCGAELPEPAAQLARRPDGEGQGQHVRRVHHPDGGGVRDPVRDRAGLAGPGAGQHADRAPRGQGHLALLGIQPGQQRVRRDLGHCTLIWPFSPRERNRPRRCYMIR